MRGFFGRLTAAWLALTASRAPRGARADYETVPEFAIPPRRMEKSPGPEALQAALRNAFVRVEAYKRLSAWSKADRRRREDRQREDPPPALKLSAKLSMPKPHPLTAAARAEAQTDVTLAMDEQIIATSRFYEESEWSGYGFMGYPLLADLAQIPEFQKPPEIIAGDMTREWVELSSVGDDDKTDRIRELTDLMKEIGVQEKFRQAFEYDMRFGICHIFIDLGETEGDEVAMPLIVDKVKIGKGALKGIRVVEPIWVYPDMYNSQNPLRPDFYRPQSWYALSVKVHQSRLMTFVSRPVPDLLKPAYLFGGLSLTQILWDYVQNWLRTRQSVSDITHNFSTPTWGTDLTKLIEKGGEEEFAGRAQVYTDLRDNQGLFVYDKQSEEFDIKAAPLGSLDKLQAQAQEQMASVCSIPLVKMFGIQPTGLNVSSEGEIQVYYDTIASLQERVGTPHLRYLLDIMMLSLWGEIDKAIVHRWRPLKQMTEKERAELEKARADTTGVLLQGNVVRPEEVRKALASDKEGMFATLNINDPPPQPMPDPAAEPNPMEEGGEHEETPASPEGGSSGVDPAGGRKTQQGVKETA